MTDNYRYFKFRQINKYFIDSLVSPSLYFASPFELNDPFDCRLNARVAFAKAAMRATGRQRQFLQSALDHATLLDDFGTSFAHQLGVCSFSLTMRQTLMWSHYADRHRGVCVLYEFPPDFILLDKSREILGVDKVRYGPKELIDFLASDGGRDAREMNTFLNAFFPKYLMSKMSSWRYEKEARILRGSSGLLPVPANYIKQICFGLLAPQADIDMVVKLATAHCDCTKFAKVVPSTKTFGFTFPPL